MQLRIALESGLGSQGAAAAGLGIVLHLGIFYTDFPAEDYMYTLLGSMCQLCLQQAPPIGQ